MSRDHYNRYANGIVALHVAWTTVILAGAVTMFFWHPYAIAEIVVVSFTLLISLPFGVCPLTLLEGKLRRKGGDPSYDSMFSFMPRRRI